MTPDHSGTQPPGRPLGYGQLIRGNRNFRQLWYGQIVSLLGDWFNLVASAALIAQLSGSALAIGSLFVIRMLAPFLVSPLAGVVADQYDRRSILIWTDLVRAGVVLGFLLVRQPEHVWLLYALTALQLGVSGFFYPARTSILPSIVPPDGIGVANAVNSVTWSVMLALGAGIGGLVSGTFGLYPAFVVDSLTCLVSAFFIFRIALPADHRNGDSQKASASGFQLYREGLAYLSRHRQVLILATHKATVALFVSAGFQVVQVEIADEVFRIGEGGGISLGLMFGVAGVGTGVGPILARRFTRDQYRPTGWAIALGYLLCAAGLFITAPLWNFESVLLGTFIRGAGGGIVWVLSTQLLLQLTPRHVLGRVFGTEFAIFTLAGAVGALLTGWAVDTPLHLRGTTLVMGLLCGLPLWLWTAWLSRQERIAR